MYSVKRIEKGDVIESNRAYTVTLNQPQYAVVDEGGDVVIEHNQISGRCLYCMSDEKASMVSTAKVWNSDRDIVKATACRMDA